MLKSLSDSMIVSGVLASLVPLVFVFRMWIRISMQRVGWEDIWAAVAFICGALNIVSGWVYFVNLGVGQSSITATWIYMFTLTCLVWYVNIPDWCSWGQVQILQGKHLHIYGLRIIVLFLLACSATIAHKAITCSDMYHTFRSTPSYPHFLCAPRTLIFSELAVGSVGDIIAIAFPLYVLRSVSLPHKQLRLLRLLFSSNIVVPIGCWLRTASQIVPVLTNWTHFINNFQVASCLMVCNLLVVVTYLYRVLRCQKHAAHDDTSESNTTTDRALPASTTQQMTLTTIELLFSTQRSEGASAATSGIVR